MQIGNSQRHRGLLRPGRQFGRVNTDELCVDDVCVTRDEFLRMKESQTGAAGAPIRDTVGAPAETSMSSGHDDGDEPEATTPELPAAEETSPDADEPVDNPEIEGAIDAESSAEPELQASNDNSPVEPLAATGTE